MGKITEFKGTKGPWKYQDDCVQEGFYILTVDNSHRNTFIGDVGGGLQNKSEIEANARLIAAAPDLLEACKEALRHHQGGHSEIGHMLRDVITKAES